MKTLTSLLLLSTIQLTIVHAQQVYADSIAPVLQFSEWTQGPVGGHLPSDKPIVLEFWSTWCGPCVAAIPHMNDLTEQFGDQVTFISVNSYQNAAVVKPFLVEKPIEGYVALDQDQYLSRSFAVSTIPVTVLIDDAGKLRWRGRAKDLTATVLDHFLERDTFTVAHKSGILLDEDYILPEDSLPYHLTLTYGDNTLGKGVSQSLEKQFYFARYNYDIYSLLSHFSDVLQREEEFNYEGRLPEGIVYDLTITSDFILTEENAKMAAHILDDVSLQLAKALNFEVTAIPDTQAVWQLYADSIHLEQYRSANQDTEPGMVDRTAKSTTYESTFIEYLVPTFSKELNKSVQYGGTNWVGYDWIIPHDITPEALTIYLKETYGIEFVEREQPIMKKTVTFR